MYEKALEDEEEKERLQGNVQELSRVLLEIDGEKTALKIELGE